MIRKAVVGGILTPLNMGNPGSLLFFFYNLRTDHLENTSSNSSPVVTWVNYAVGLCLLNRFLAIDISSHTTLLTFSLFITIYLLQ
jgi:hypothetical protein